MRACVRACMRACVCVCVCVCVCAAGAGRPAGRRLVAGLLRAGHGGPPHAPRQTVKFVRVMRRIRVIRSSSRPSADGQVCPSRPPHPSHPILLTPLSRRSSLSQSSAVSAARERLRGQAEPCWMCMCKRSGARKSRARARACARTIVGWGAGAAAFYFYYYYYYYYYMRAHNRWLGGRSGGFLFLLFLLLLLLYARTQSLAGGQERRGGRGGRAAHFAGPRPSSSPLKRTAGPLGHVRTRFGNADANTSLGCKARNL